MDSGLYEYSHTLFTSVLKTKSKRTKTGMKESIAQKNFTEDWHGLFTSIDNAVGIMKSTKETFTPASRKCSVHEDTMQVVRDGPVVDV